MFSNQNLTKILIIWAFLTLFIVLALMGAVTVANYTKLSGGTCSSIGGQWTAQNDEYACIVNKEK